MRNKVASHHEFIDELRRRKVASPAELAEHFSCTKRTVFKRLEGAGHLTSYNRNSTVMTLPGIPEWDENGLWEYQGVLFSRWGDLVETMVKLIDDSEWGLTGRELGTIMSNDHIFSHLGPCLRKGLVYRDGARRSAVYYSADARKRRVQMKRRGSELRTRVGRPPGLTQRKIIDVLALALKYHATSEEELLRLVRATDIGVSERGVRWIVQEYEIKKKGFRSGS